MPKQQSALSPNLSLKRIVRKPAVRSKGGIVVTQHRIASEIGARVLKEGGYEGTEAIIYQSLPAPFRPELEDQIVATVRKLNEQVSSQSK